MDNQGGTETSSKDRKDIFEQYLSFKDKGTKTFRNASQAPMGSGDSKKDSQKFINDNNITTIKKP